MLFDRAWIERELAGLIVQLHQTEGAISVLQQMLTQLDENHKHNGAVDTAPDGLTLEQFEALLPPGDRIEGIIEHED
jgi:hypothetical protein